MRSKQELLLGKQAIAMKYITKEQWEQCIEIQKKDDIVLPLIFLKHKLVPEEKLWTLMEVHFRKVNENEEAREKGEDLVFCRLLLRSKAMPLDTVLKLVMNQKESQTKFVSIGELIVKNRTLPLNAFLEIYNKIFDETIACSACEKEFRLISLSPGKKLRCKHCKTVFSVPTIEDEIARYDNEAQNLASKPKEEAFADHEILEEIAEGGMGIIYRAQKKSTGQIVALKVLREANRSSPEAKERFAREARTLSKLKHKNIVSILDVGIEKEVPYFTMDFVEGKPLSELIAQRSLSLEQSIQIVIKVCEGLQYAHESGIIHRDIKPSNIIIEKNEEPRITDFGLAKCIDSATMVTRSGTMLGTPYYMSPEQARGHIGLVGPRSDIYALGVVFYEMLTGENPFKGENTVEIYHKILTIDPTPPSALNPQVRKSIDNICLKCLKKDTFQRYKNALEVANDLRVVLEGKKGIWHSLKKLFGK